MKKKRTRQPVIFPTNTSSMPVFGQIIGKPQSKAPPILSNDLCEINRRITALEKRLQPQTEKVKLATSPQATRK